MPDNIDRKLRAILFADIADYTLQMQQDESAARNFIRVFRSEIHAHVAHAGGEVVNFYGDGCVCIFESSVNAVDCAWQLQKAFISSRVPVRIGLHSGDVYFEETNVYGDSVNIASRVESLAVPGSILFSSRVRTDIKNQQGMTVRSLGTFEFKNVEEPIEVFALDSGELVVPERHELGGKLKPATTSNKAKTSQSRQGWMIGVFVVAVVGIVGWSVVKSSVLSGKSASSDTLTMAVLDFGNSTGNSDFDLVPQMAANRVIHGITQNDLATVVTQDAVDSYRKVLLSSPSTVDELDWLRSEMSVDKVVKGNVYLDGEELIFEATITDAHSKSVVSGIPVVRCAASDPMKGIEELRQRILGAFASQKDKGDKLLLETTPPKFAAYKELLLAKQTLNPDKHYEHLMRAMALDSNYFEPQVILVAHYYNTYAFAAADSMLATISARMAETDSRQQNLVDFYDALLKGKSNLVQKFLHREWVYAPFDMPTNRTLMVIALQFTYDLPVAMEAYQVAASEQLDYASCQECRIRLFLKMYYDLEQGNNTSALEGGKTLLSANGEEWASRLMFRVYARLDSAAAITDLISRLAEDNPEYAAFDLHLAAAREYFILEDTTSARDFAQRAGSHITPETELLRRGEMHLMLGDNPKALDLFQQATEQDPDDLRAWGFLAGVAMQEGKSKRAEAAVTQLESLRGAYQFGDVDYQLARAFAIGGNRDRAMTLLRASIAKGQRNDFHQFHNDYLFHPGKYREELLGIMKYWL